MDGSGRLRAAEHRGTALPRAQRLPDQPELGQAFVHARQRLLRGQVLRVRQEPAAQLVVDRAAVVGVHQAEIPQLGALIDVRHARRGQLEQGLGQRGDAPGADQRSHERLHVAAELRVVERIVHEPGKGLLVRASGCVQEVWALASRDAFSM